jgi:Protein of unknown function (DUF2946)
MGRIRTNRRRLVWLAIVAILGNVVVFASRHAPVESAIEDMFGAHLNCTADGGGVPTPGDRRDGDDKPGHCAACTLLAGFALVVALAFAGVAFASVSLFRPLGFDLGTLAEHLSLGGIRSRAPPLPA